MTDTNKLKELAERADHSGQHIYSHPRDSNNWKANEEFIAACSADAVLGLIAEVERLRSDLPRLVSYAEDLSTCTLTMDDGIGYFYNRVTDQELAEIDQLTQEVAWLRKRLEIDDRTPYDGISCRDETIKGLDEKCDRLKAENEALRSALKPFAEYERVRSEMGGNAPRAGTLFGVNTRAGDAEITVEDMQAAQAALEGGSHENP